MVKEILEAFSPLYPWLWTAFCFWFGWDCGKRACREEVLSQIKEWDSLPLGHRASALMIHELQEAKRGANTRKEEK